MKKEKQAAAAVNTKYLMDIHAQLPVFFEIGWTDFPFSAFPVGRGRFAASFYSTSSSITLV